MKYILDTDILIYLLKGQPNVVERVTAFADEELATTIINQTELLAGVFNSERKVENLKNVEALLNRIAIVPFCQKASYIFAEHKAQLKKQGTLIDDFDLMIASIALQNKSILVTNNTKHFSRIKKLEIENWS